MARRLAQPRALRRQHGAHARQHHRLVARAVALLAWCAAPGPVAGDLAPRRARIERFIQVRQSDAQRLADLAAEFGVGTERARHLVGACCGVSFQMPLPRARMQAAGALLLNTDLAIAAVGERCGIPDPSHFQRLFRRHHGISPGAFRKARRG